jgi:CBS domain-containing protein
MSKHNAVVHINTPINTIIELINVPDSRYIPVLDEDGKVIGVITPSNVIDLLNNY